MFQAFRRAPVPRALMFGLALATLAACSKPTTGAQNSAATNAPAAAPAQAGPAVAAAPVEAASDRTHDRAGCADPAWAPQRIVGFQLSGCNTLAWATLDVDVVGHPGLELAGKRTEVTYSLADGSQSGPAAAPARMAVVQQAIRSGARLVSNPNDEDGAVLTEKTPQGEFWYVYTHGTGNASSTLSYSTTTLQVLPLAQEVQAWPMTAPPDPKAHTCANPPWLVKQFSYFKVDGCTAKAWDVVPVSLPGGDRKLQGARMTVNFTLTDPAQTPSALAVEKNYVGALQAIGAKLVSNPADSSHLVMTQQLPFGEVWYFYDQGTGNSDAVESYSVTTVLAGPFPQEVQAQPMKGPLAPKGKACAYPPWLVKQFSYFKLVDCSYRDFDQVTVTLPSGPKTLAGHILTSEFTLTDPVQDPTALALQTNYVNALQGIGAARMSDPANVDQAVLTQKTAEGELWYVVTHTSGNDESTGSYELVTVQLGGPPPKTCTIEVYGVNFDFDKSVLRPDSEPVLQQLLALFKGDPTYVAEVGGHTDNVGQAGYNLQLSGARAEAVRDWLIAHGVAASRLTAKGYGDTRPLVPNTTDAGRAKNRRVELKRANCKGG